MDKFNFATNILIIIIILAFICLVSYLFFVIKDTSNRNKECIQKGGIMIEGYGDYICVEKNDLNIIEL